MLCGEPISTLVYLFINKAIIGMFCQPQKLFYYCVTYLHNNFSFFVFHIAMPKQIDGAKIACLDFSLQKAKMQLGVQVLVTDPEKLDAIRQRWVLKFTIQEKSVIHFIISLNSYQLIHFAQKVIEVYLDIIWKVHNH